MLFKFSLLAVFAFLQVNVAFGQQQVYPGSQGAPGQGIQGMTPTQMWSPYSWITPYYQAANDAWGKYIRDAQEASNQLYQQWDKTGAANLFNLGMDVAKQAALIAAQQAKQAEQAAQQAAQQAQQAAQQAAQQGQEAVQSVSPF